MAKDFAPIPQTQEDANGPAGARTLVVIGGLLSAVFLLPTVPWLWVGIGVVLVPWVWISSGRKRQRLMESARCETKDEWKLFVASLPTKKQLAAGETSVAAAPGTALAAMQHAERSGDAPKTRPAVARSTSKPSASQTTRRPELQLPEYPLLAGGYANYEVVGEYYRQKSVIRALGGLTPEVEKTLEDVTTHLIPEPENPHGQGHAVMVWMNGQHVGYLASEDAGKYFPFLSRVVSQGYLPTTTGRVWGVSRSNYQGKLDHHLYVRVALNEPEQLFPTNAPPLSQYSFLPWGPAIQVTKEVDYLAELTEHLHGPDSYAIATLRPAERTLKNGTVREYVTVHLDGDEVGELTTNMSEKILPAVRHLNDLDFEATAWARVKGTPIAIEVTLQVAKSHEIPHEWFASVPVTIPVLRK